MTSDALCTGCGGPVDPGKTLCTACAGDPAAATQADAPTIARMNLPFALPGLAFRGLIGEGGMGSVYLAEEVALGRRVAVKMIAERYAADPGVKSRFLREARSMATLEHPHVVRIYAYGEAGSTAYLTMEYVEGEDLATRLRKSGRLGVDETIRLAGQIVDALETAWEHRIVHRDIKPSNILIDRRGSARVADFGLAKPLTMGDDGSLTQSGYLLGTPQYISPEQAQGKPIDFRSDVYSLGVMLHHLLVGRHPYEASTPVALVAKHLTEPLPPLDAVRPDVPPELAQLVDWMTRKDPEERPSSYREIRERLAAMMASTPPRPVPTVRVPVTTWSRGAQLKLAAALLVVAGLAGIYAVQFRGGGSPKTPETALAAPADPRFALAVAPFYGPDEDSAKEGRVMAALVERAVERRLGAKNVRIFGIDVTEKPVRDHDAARALGTRLAADAVIWGEALSYRDETEITPQVTILTGRKKPQQSEPDERAAMGAADSLSQLEEAPVQPVTLESEAPNQIEMRKMSAAGLGDVALFLAGVHALNKLENPGKALELFRQAPPSHENLRYQVQALVAGFRGAEAIPLLEQLAREQPDASTSAQLGDLYAAAGRVRDAALAYRAAAEGEGAWATSRGFWSGGRLYLKEVYAAGSRTAGTERESGYLLAVDPETGRVEARYRLPGYVLRFEPSDESIAIPYAYRPGDAEDATLHFANGAFEEPRPFGALVLRVAGAKAGKALAINFLSEIEKRREVGDIGLKEFRVTRIEDHSAPSTLPDLERELRAAAERDPTQPWHPFFLGHALAGQGKPREADAVWGAMARGAYPETPYYEWAAMSSIAEKQGNTRLADATFARARNARARIEQPSYFTFLLERLINVPFVRAGASIPDMERRFLLVERGRQLAANEAEADIFAAAAWAKYWEESGDTARARRERERLRAMRGDPFNIQSLNALVDYAITAFLASVVTALVVLLVLVPTAFRRAREASAPRDVGALVRRIPRVWVVVGGALLVAAVLLDVAWRLATMRPALQLVGPLAAIALLAWISWRSGVSPIALAGSITGRERIAMACVLAALLTSAVGLLPVHRIGAVASLPFGVSDALGAIGTSDAFEERYGKSPTAEMAFLTGLSHHYGGRAAKAKTYYGKASAAVDVKPWTASLSRGDEPPPPSHELLTEGLLGGSGSFKSSWSVIEEAIASIGPFIYLAALIAVLTLASLVVRRRPVPEDGPRPAGVASRLLMLLVPGVYDLRRGNPIRGAANLFLAIVWILPVVVLIKAEVPAPGLLTALWLPDIVGSTPLPFTPDQGPLEYGWAAFLLVYPWARLFWGLMAFSLAAALALHLTRIPRILRLARPGHLSVPAPAAS